MAVDAPLSAETLRMLRGLYPMLRRHLPAIELREVLEAAAGWKVARVALGEREALTIVPALRAASLCVAVSEERYLDRADSGKGGWSNRVAEILPGDAGRGDVYVYVARADEDVLSAADAEADGDGERFGRELGIPGCCRRAFMERLDRIRAAQNDPVTSTILGTESSPPHPLWTNVCAQYFGASLLGFAPCSLDCAAAADSARRACELIRALDAAMADRFIKTHASDIVYSEWHGIHRLHGTRWSAGTLCYGGVESTATGPLAEALCAADRLIPDGARSFRLQCGDVEVPVPREERTMGLFLCGAGR